VKYTNIKSEKRTSKTKLTKGAFGKTDYPNEYKTLKVINKSKRKDNNCNKNGII